MASLIAVLLFAILFSFNKNVCCLSDSNQEVNSIFTKNSLDTLLVKPEEPEATPSLKAKMQTLIENMLENITQTEISMGRNVSFNESTTSEEDHGILRGHKNLQNEYTTPTESSDYEDDYHTESRFDDSGCDTHLRDEHEDDCFDNFKNAITKTMEIEDEVEQGKEICCASEGYERCCIIGYERANCVADHSAIKKDLKAARMFMATLSDISCSIHRGKCGFNTATTLSLPASFLLIILGFLPIAFFL